MKIFIHFLVTLCLLFPCLAFAELSVEVANDFAVVDGVVVMPVNDEYIIDLDAGDGLNNGDIFSVVRKTDNIFHPQTGEVIGTIDEVIGYLQVMRILSGYSYAKLLADADSLESGATIKRYEQVPARLVMDEGADETLARQLKADLPQLTWIESEDAEALLTFNLTSNGLTVYNQQNVSIHRYHLLKDQLVSQTAQKHRPTIANTPGSTSTGSQKPLRRLANTIVGVFGTTNEERFAEMDQAIIRQRQLSRDGVWMGPEMKGHPNAMTVADLNGDSRLEIVVVLENVIQVGRILDGQYNQVAEIETSDILQILSVDTFDLDNNGSYELYVSAMAGNRPASFVVEYANGDYHIAIDQIRWLMRSVLLPGESKRALVGQRTGDNNRAVYTGDVFRVRREGRSLLQDDSIQLPGQLNLFNFTALADQKNQSYYAYLTEGDYLKVVTMNGEELWESDNYFGGSETCFKLESKFRDEMEVPNCVRPRMIMLPGNELLVVQNEGQRMLQRFRRFKQSRLVSMSWNGFAFEENWQTATQSGYLGDFAYADADNDGQDELVMVIKFKHSGLTGEARSSIVIYEMD